MFVFRPFVPFEASSAPPTAPVIRQPLFILKQWCNKRHWGSAVLPTQCSQDHVLSWRGWGQRSSHWTDRNRPQGKVPPPRLKMNTCSLVRNQSYDKEWIHLHRRIITAPSGPDLTSESAKGQRSTSLKTTDSAPQPDTIWAPFFSSLRPFLTGLTPPTPGEGGVWVCAARRSDSVADPEIVA